MDNLNGENAAETMHELMQVAEYVYGSEAHEWRGVLSDDRALGLQMNTLEVFVFPISRYGGTETLDT